MLARVPFYYIQLIMSASAISSGGAWRSSSWRSCHWPQRRLFEAEHRGALSGVGSAVVGSVATTGGAIGAATGYYVGKSTD